MAKPNTVGVKGVSIDRKSKVNPYRATIQISKTNLGKVNINIGNFPTPEAAFKARRKYLMNLL